VAPATAWRRYVGPAAFLLVATVAVLLVRAGLESGSRPAQRVARAPAASSPAAATTTAAGRRPRRYWTVRAGDTFATVAAHAGVSVAAIARLNPGVHSTSLFIGQRLRVR
jgi:hypothetical protein